MPGHSPHITNLPIKKYLLLACLLALFLGCGFQLSGQTSEYDSLMAVWRDEMQADTTRLQAINRVIKREDIGREPDSALYFVNLQYAFAEQKGEKKWQSIALATKAKILSKSGTYQEAFQCYRQDLEIQKELQDIMGLALTYKDMGYILRKQGHYGEALEYYQKSLDTAEQLGKKGRSRRAATLNSMGSLFLDQGDYDNALKHYEQSLALHLELKKKIGIASNYNNIGLVYQNLKDYDRSLDYSNRSLSIKKELADNEGIANTYQSIGNINFSRGRFAEAKTYYERSYHLRDSFGLKDDLAESCCRLGLVALEFEQYQEAVRWCTQGRALSRSVGNIGEESGNCECLYLAHKNLGNNMLALAYHEQLLTLKDSLINEEATRQLARLEMQYQYEKEKAAAEIVQARERAVMETRLQQQSTLRNIFIAVALIFALLSYLTFRVNQSRRRKNIELNRKNEQIEKDRQTITHQAKELQKLDELKSRFFTNISHELRTPVTLITAPAEQLIRQEGSKLSSNANMYLRHILNNGRKLLRLVEELLDLSRLDANKLELHEQPTNLEEFCRQLYSSFLSKAEINQIDYTCHSELGGQEWYWIDRKRLEKVINNLLGNALKFTPKDGEVQLIVSREQRTGNGEQEPTPENPDTLLSTHFLLVSVSDTGRGIPPEDLPHVFDRYFQTKRKDIAAEGGAGVGLALSIELARLMKGTLSVQSEWGKGSAFTLRFPARITDAEETQALKIESRAISEGREAAVAAAGKQPAAGKQDKPTILVVEDNPDMQQLIQSLLKEDYNCHLAGNGAEAWSLLQQGPLNLENLDLIISDIMMPEMDGYTLLEHLKAHDKYRQLPVIMLTARAAESDRLQALRLGVDDYLTKPFSPEELLVRSANLIRNYQERQAFNATNPHPVEIGFEAGASADQEWLKELEEAALAAMEKKIELSRSYLADEMALSERQLLRRIKALTGLSVKHYVQEVKLQKARILLENKIHETVAEIAYACGFNAAGYFSKVYKKHFGKNPSEYFSEVP